MWIECSETQNWPCTLFPHLVFTPRFKNKYGCLKKKKKSIGKWLTHHEQNKQRMWRQSFSQRFLGLRAAPAGRLRPGTKNTALCSLTFSGGRATCAVQRSSGAAFFHRKCSHVLLADVTPLLAKFGLVFTYFFFSECSQRQAIALKWWSDVWEAYHPSLLEVFWCIFFSENGIRLKDLWQNQRRFTVLA